ncbi:MAG: zinc ribbon domain-containing protein [Phycisphaerales bacterium]
MASRPLDDQPDRAITRRAEAAKGEVESYTRSGPRSPADDGPQEADIEKFGGVTVKCPECGADLYDEAELCFKCGAAVTAWSDRRRRVWPTVIVVLLILAVLTAYLMGNLR